jgi:hypothetical protein
MARWRARRLLPLLTFVTLGMILGELLASLPTGSFGAVTRLVTWWIRA